jgi:hypothetical protein
MATSDEALSAAFEAGAISLCPKHSYNIIRSNDPALTRMAFEIASAKIEQRVFSSERSLLMEAINDVIELAEDECHCCANAQAYRARLAVDRRAPKPCPCKAPTCPTFGTVNALPKAA